MASITIKVSELFEMAKELKDNKEELVTISITDEEDLDGWDMPPSIHFRAISSSDPDSSTDYEEIYSFDSDV